MIACCLPDSYAHQDFDIFILLSSDELRVTSKFFSAPPFFFLG
ncbi:hypothetical protein SynWH8103_00533 [Synechococcus sp. WH 8103]|nr:hypothetical protein SynWH8103_00533 [Synechococcus sp. WH 8103]